MITIFDSNRTLQFEGQRLSNASSKRADSLRWVEFELYRTAAGAYIISRVGQTLIYHAASCPVVERNSLSPIPFGALSDGLVSCPDCHPSDLNLREDDEVYPEAARHRAVVSETAEGVLEELYRFDEAGVRYITAVARRLIERAATVDQAIYSAYHNEVID
jgi:hypothetical protein